MGSGSFSLGEGIRRWFQRRATHNRSNTKKSNVISGSDYGDDDENNHPGRGGGGEAGNGCVSDLCGESSILIEGRGAEINGKEDEEQEEEEEGRKGRENEFEIHRLSSVRVPGRVGVDVHPATMCNTEVEFFNVYGEAGRYQVQEVIGKGSYGVVGSAVDTHAGERVAIKKIHDVFEHVSDATRILREIKLLRLLRHPDIVEIRRIMLPPSR